MIEIFRKWKIAYFIILGLFSTSYACTEFLLSDLQNNVIVGRSMEFGLDLDSVIMLFPKGKRNTSMLPNKQKGLSWINKYAYLGLNSFGTDMLSDGMNEEGLSLGVLWFPTAKYPNPPSDNFPSAIALEDLGSWLLGSFANVEEVRNAITSIQIWAHEIPQLKMIPPIHLSIQDKTGKGLVVEFIDGKIELIANPIGVVTNCPDFKWHLSNLSNYIHLSFMNVESKTIDNFVVNPTGQGTGLIGIPGDWTPPSRFVKIAYLKNNAIKAKNSKENQNLAIHLLNTVDIPYGIFRPKEGKNFEYTQWAVIKDLTNGILFYRTYHDMTIKTVNLLEETKTMGNNVKKISMKGTNN